VIERGDRRNRPGIAIPRRGEQVGLHPGGEAVRPEGKRILLAWIVCLGAIPAWARDGRPPEGFVTVAVHNRAGVARNTLALAERTASSIFRQAGVDIVWANCELPVDRGQIASSCHVTAFPMHLQLSIAQRSENLRESVLGVSFLAEDGSGCYSDVFFERVRELHERFNVNLGPLLGDVIAHEIAHLLLGTNAHSDTGIMRAHWSGQDLVKASKSQLLFTEAQGRTMREKVSARFCRKESALVAAGAARD